MNIAPVLTAVYAYPQNGYAPATNLEVGKAYVVSDVKMGTWSTDIWLEGIKGVFNSVQFDFFENDEPVDIFDFVRYNPFLR